MGEWPYLAARRWAVVIAWSFGSELKPESEVANPGPDPELLLEFSGDFLMTTGGGFDLARKPPTPRAAAEAIGGTTWLKAPLVIYYNLHTEYSETPE